MDVSFVVAFGERCFQEAWKQILSKWRDQGSAVFPPDRLGEAGEEAIGAAVQTQSGKFFFQILKKIGSKLFLDFCEIFATTIYLIIKYSL